MRASVIIFIIKLFAPSDFHTSRKFYKHPVLTSVVCGINYLRLLRHKESGGALKFIVGFWKI